MLTRLKQWLNERPGVLYMSSYMLLEGLVTTILPLWIPRLSTIAGLWTFGYTGTNAFLVLTGWQAYFYLGFRFCEGN